MSRAQEIREALAVGAMTFAELAGKLGGDEGKLKGILGYLVKQGQISGIGRGEQRSFAMTKDGHRGGAGKPKKRAGKKRGKKTPAGKRGDRPFKRIADAIVKTACPMDAPARAQKLLQHVHTTFASLKAVLDFDGNDPILSATFRSHEQAIELLNG